MTPKNVQMPNPNPKYKPPGTAGGGRGGNTMKKCYDHEECEYNAQPDCVLPEGAQCPHGVPTVPPVTNADKIRAMSDEELAKYLSNPCDCAVDPERDGYRECGNDLCVKYLLEWLQQPAEEEKL